MPYLFVAATIIAAISLMIFSKINLDKIKHDPEKVEEAQHNLLIGLFVSEVIPIILIVFGFITMQKAVSFEALFLPIALVILFFLAAILYVILQTKVDVPDEVKGRVTLLGMLGVGLAGAIPIISFMGLILMIP